MGAGLSSPPVKHQKILLCDGDKWQQQLRELLEADGLSVSDAQGLVFDSDGRAVALSSTRRTPLRFPLHVVLPQGGSSARRGRLQLKLELILKNVAGKQDKRHMLETAFLGTVSGSSPSKGLRRSESLCSLVNTGLRILKVYVQVSCSGQEKTTCIREVEQGGEALFDEESSVIFDLEDDGHGAPHSPSKASSHFRDIRIAVHEKRSSWIRGDAIIGTEHLRIPSPAPASVGKTEQKIFRLRRRGNFCQDEMCVRYTFLRLEEAKATLAASAKHSVLTIARALVQLLQVPGGVQLLLSSRPKGIRDVTKEEIYVELERLKELLLEPWAESQEALFLEKMSEIARQLLDFVEKRSEIHADIPGLIVQWMRHLSSQVPIRAALRSRGSPDAMMSEERLRRFLASAQLRLEGLVPIDAEGQVDQTWRQQAKAMREVGTWHFALDQIPDLAVVGSGSFGTVWRAQDSHTGRLYAVKNVAVPRRGFAKAAQHESDVADRLSKEPHRCVVELFHAKHFPDLRLYCFVMEYCEKGNLKVHIGSLRESLHKENRLYTPPVQAFHWIAQIMLGMEHLHMMGLLVRDLKADNVVLNHQGHAKLTDFGLCRFGTEATGDWTFGVPPGTPAYIAPEVTKGQDYGLAADMYSFGALMWVILTGGQTAVKNSRGQVAVSFEAVPPCATMAHNWDYSALANNWRLIAACVTDPENNFARPLPDKDVEQLVLSLTSEEAQQRPSFQELRKSRAFGHLKLPRPSASLKEVDAWLNYLLRLCCLSCGGQGCGLCKHFSAPASTDNSDLRSENGSVKTTAARPSGASVASAKSSLASRSEGVVEAPAVPSRVEAPGASRVEAPALRAEDTQPAQKLIFQPPQRELPKEANEALLPKEAEAPFQEESEDEEEEEEEEEEEMTPSSTLDDEAMETSQEAAPAIPAEGTQGASSAASEKLSQSLRKTEERQSEPSEAAVSPHVSTAAPEMRDTEASNAPSSGDPTDVPPALPAACPPVEGSDANGEFSAEDPLPMFEEANEEGKVMGPSVTWLFPMESMNSKSRPLLGLTANGLGEELGLSPQSSRHRSASSQSRDSSTSGSSTGSLWSTRSAPT